MVEFLIACCLTAVMAFIGAIILSLVMWIVSVVVAILAHIFFGGN